MGPKSFFLVLICLLPAGVVFGVQEVGNVLVMIADDAGFQTPVYGNTKCLTPHLSDLANRSVVFQNAFTSVSSCSPSRSAIMTGMPQHQNGLYGLHHTVHHYNSFDNVRSLPRILNDTGKFFTGIIGKKHVGPDYVYPFDFSYTEENFPINQIGRNITLMKQLARKFLSDAAYSGKPFFLYIGFHDPHRCGLTNPEFGAFCERFGDGHPGMGVIPDWMPTTYNAEDVEVPYFVQDTPTARADIAAQYQTMSRLDQGVGLMMEALKDYGFDKNTLVIFSSDNGIPFPNGRTNLYDSGMAEPFLISSPFHTSRWGEVSEAMISLTDIVPTVLDWFGLPYPNYTLFGPNPTTLLGKSLLPVLEAKSNDKDYDTVYASHNIHEVTMYYPMRAVRTRRYKLIHNLSYRSPFLIDQDFYASPTFQDLLNRTVSGKTTYWFKTLEEYYYRNQWELYDITSDPREINNLAEQPQYSSVLQELQEKLHEWQAATNDPWICSPSAVLEDQGNYPHSGVCLPFHNEHNVDKIRPHGTN